MFEIWVDEGHGGADSGAVGGGFKEDDRNLALGNEVVRLSKIQGWDVKRTRSTDTFVMLTDRYKKANAATSAAACGVERRSLPQRGQKSVQARTAKRVREAAALLRAGVGVL